MEFLTARLNEDEAAGTEAIASIEEREEPFWSDVFGAYNEGFLSRAEAEHVGRHDPARALREVEAKRKILALTFQYDLMIDLLIALAVVYSDHPDYRSEWAS